MTPEQPEQRPLRSTFAGDPEMAELVQYFVNELGSRAGALHDALGSGDAERLRTVAHQLKGAAGGYGFPDISDTADAVEQTVLAGEAETSALTEQVEALIQLCRRACSS
jgi:HPt (histidine-containing phosphotransfer) domain-containing protein